VADARRSDRTVAPPVRRGGGAGLALRNLVFTLVVPGAGGLAIPWWILAHGAATPGAATWPGAALIALGAGLYGWCLWLFATVGRGTPGPWDAPRRLVAVGPYRWVRNPIYLAALLVVVGEAWWFLSLALLEYAAVMAITCHLFVMVYEEPSLSRTFGDAYAEYRRAVPRWLPRRPRGG
jgi:protein-S-isoprenylcysteine O-methyltransferase Ste14